jgi:hypothetical protein
MKWGRILRALHSVVFQKYSPVTQLTIQCSILPLTLLKSAQHRSVPSHSDTDDVSQLRMSEAITSSLQFCGFRAD